ncbi:MAG: hypothetical protein N2322_06880, partial [Terrimicrobiaceae bacterium]|nr:hypothetical protein [Terrimicrobiaceae bacterium]
MRRLECVFDNGSPFPGPRLDAAVAAAILRKARGLAQRAGRVRLVFEVAEGGAGDEGLRSRVAQAVRASFEEVAAERTLDLAELYREARRTGLLAVVLALFLLGASELLFANEGWPLALAAARGMLVLAWVALWHPAELLLYAHFP